MQVDLRHAVQHNELMPSLTSISAADATVKVDVDLSAYGFAQGTYTASQYGPPDASGALTPIGTPVTVSTSKVTQLTNVVVPSEKFRIWIIR